MAAKRAVRLSSVLGDALRFRRLRGEEALSRPFRFELELASDDPAIELADLLGTPMAVEIELLGGGSRWFHGLVSRFALASYENQEVRYQATLRPWLWFLTRTTDCRIFQEKTVLDIVQATFAKHAAGGVEVENRLSGTFQPRVYCVQYRESDLDFVDRLLQDEGITYFFVHAADRHTLVLADAPSAHVLCPGYGDIPYFPRAALARRERDHIHDWNPAAEVRSGSVARTSFNFEKPRADLLARRERPLPQAAWADGELYHYSGRYLEPEVGEHVATLRLEADQADHRLVAGEGTAAGLMAGHRFALRRYPREDQNADYLLREVAHEIRDPAYRSGEVPDEEAFEVYHGRFTAMPADLPYRPPLITPRPLIQGPQTAMVTGPSEEEIWTDKYGRVKVQFPWDREGRRDEKSSCWIRVSQAWAGTAFGMVVLPRIGQEVVVEFLEGDPDRPLITGRVYNARAMPPYPLPAGQNQSGLKSNSTKGGGGSNELMFDDTKGKEKVFLHAQFDMDAVVEHDETHTVHGKRTRKIDGTDTVVVGEGRATSVNAGGDRLTVTGDRTVSSTTKHRVEAPAVEIQGAATVTIDGATVSINATTSLTVSVGASSIKLDPSGVTIVGPLVRIS